MISTIRWKRVMAAVLSLCLIMTMIPLLPGEGYLATAAAKESPTLQSQQIRMPPGQANTCISGNIIKGTLQIRSQ